MISKAMVSIIILSHNRGDYVEETVRSVMSQTYQNWRLFFIDDNSSDNTLAIISRLKDEFSISKNDGLYERPSDRIIIYKTIFTRGESYNRNWALKEIQEGWVAFLDVGDVWAPDKLEKQIAFMEEHSYAFSYTGYGLMDRWSRNRGVMVSGKAHVTHDDMLKCCWPAYLTVMYDVEKVGQMKVRAPHENDYGLWLKVSNRHDCYLLDENLATMRTKWRSLLGRILLTNSIKWRYDAYRYDEDLDPVTSFFYTIRNGWYGIVKWMKYVKSDKAPKD